MSEQERDQIKENAVDLVHQVKQIDRGLTETFIATKPFLSSMSQQFLLARDVAAHEKAQREVFEQTQDAIKLREGSLTLEQVSRIVTIPRSILIAQAEKKRRASDQNQRILMGMLDDMRDRLVELEQRMAEHLEKLRGKYGDDVARGMADTYLTEHERAGMETDEQIFNALVGKFLDEGGNIKDEYKHLYEAKYIRDWNEAERLRAGIEKWNDLTAEEKHNVYENSEHKSLTQNKNVITSLENSDHQNTIDKSLDNRGGEAADIKETVTVHFGPS